MGSALPQWVCGQAPALFAGSDAPPGSLRSLPLLWVNALLRGVSQVCFADNPVTGAICLIALCSAMPPEYGMCVMIGLLASTGTAIGVGSERSAVAHGLFGFNGVLVGAAVATFTHFDTPTHNLAHVALTALLGALATLLSRALAVFLGPLLSLPTFTMPFNLATLIGLSGLVGVAAVPPWGAAGPPTVKLFAPSASLNPAWAVSRSRLDGNATLALPLARFPVTTASVLCLSTDPALLAFAAQQGFTQPATSECIREGLQAILRGVAQVYFCDSWGAGLALVLGFAVCSPVIAAACFLGSALGMAGGVVLGAAPDELAFGLWSYNAVIGTAAVAGVFYVLDARCIIAAVGSALLCTLLQGSFRLVFSPLSLPVLTLPFCIGASLVLLGRWPERVSLDRVATPETHARWHWARGHGVFTERPSDCEQCEAATPCTSAWVPLLCPRRVMDACACACVSAHEDEPKPAGRRAPYLMAMPSRRLVSAPNRASSRTLLPSSGGPPRPAHHSNTHTHMHTHTHTRAYALLAQPSRRLLALGWGSTSEVGPMNGSSQRAMPGAARVRPLDSSPVQVRALTHVDTHAHTHAHTHTSAAAQAPGEQVADQPSRLGDAAPVMLPNVVESGVES